MRFSSDPARSSSIRAISVLEDQKEILVIPVEVADGDDLLNPRPFVRGWAAGRGGKGEKEKAGDMRKFLFCVMFFVFL